MTESSLPNNPGQEELRLAKFTIDRALDPVFWIDQSARIRYVSSRACEVLGYERDELLQMSVPDIDPNFPQDSWQSHWENLRKNKVLTLATSHLTKDGEEIPVEVTASFIEFEGQEYNIAHARNITKQQRTEQLLTQRALQLAVLNEIGREIVGVLDVQDALGITAKLVHDHFDYHHVGIFLMQPASDDLVLHAMAGDIQVLVPMQHRLQPGEGLVGTAAKTSKTLLVNDVGKDERYINRFPDQVLTRSEVCVPVMTGDRVLGILDVQSSDLNAFDENDVIALEAVAGQLAIALENARLYHASVQELTEREETELALRESETKFRTLAEKSPNMIFINQDGRVIYANEACSDIMGYTREEFYDPSFNYMQLIGPESQEQVKVNFQEHMAGREVPPCEYKLLTKSGEVLQAIQTTRLIAYEGKPAIMGIVTDVTEIRGLQQFRANLTQSMAEGLVVQDRRGFFTFANPAAGQLLGYSEEELFGLHEHEIIPDDQVERLEAANERRRQGISEHYELQLKRKDGSRLEVLVAASPQYHHGEFAGALAVFTDITERKRIERALADSEAGYRGIFEGVQDAILVESLEGEILDVNQRACELYGYSRVELLEKTVRDLVAPGAVALIPHEDGEAELGVKPVESVNLRSNGESFPVEITARLQEISGKQVMLVVVRDMTDAHEAQLRAQEQDRLAAVGQLAAGIAHDFNNIMGTIILYSELLLANSVRSPEDTERLKTIFQQAQRGANLTSQVLDFSRRTVMERHPMDLASFMHEMCDLLRQTMPENIKINLEISDDVLMVTADPTRLQQVFMNLALNARDAMPGGGGITFGVRHGEKSDRVHIEVCDTGTGIPPDVLPHIFEPFYTTKAQGEGTGLGLSQVYGLIKQHDGSVDVASEVGKGTVFNIQLPLVDEKAHHTRPLVDPGERVGSGESILVVEDDEPIRDAVVEVLSALDYKVQYASNGREALDIVKENGGFELVITDIVMPGMGGQELYKTLRVKYPDIKVILMTGYPLGKRTGELLDHSRVTWVQKPLSTVEIASTVRSILDSD
jgi:PAS domain S-box-containing protein